MRGKVVAVCLTCLLVGITPAHAGKSRPQCPSTLRSRDHPRACGEKMICWVLLSTLLGSPPRMRGKARRCRGKTPRGGITPAHAGKSFRLRACAFFSGDHPRACGEKVLHHNLVGGNWGSPPRMRGKDSDKWTGNREDGITPAHAGKSMYSLCEYCTAWDHPRACGEKRMELLEDAAKRGSPPRMRGKAPGIGGCDLRVGITPAHAGKRNPRSCIFSSARDHPRACGEKCIFCIDVIGFVGITPAHAGKRTIAPLQILRRWDHPRACGEKFQSELACRT